MTVQEYLAFEDPGGQRYEFREGDLLSMAGGTAEHSLIGMNACGELRNRLAGSGCTVYNSDLRVKIPRRSAITTPTASSPAANRSSNCPA